MNISSQSLSFAVIRFHSLSLVVPLAVIRYNSLNHLLSFVFTRCITLLSFYKESTKKVKTLETNVNIIY